MRTKTVEQIKDERMVLISVFHAFSTIFNEVQLHCTNTQTHDRNLARPIHLLLLLFILWLFLLLSNFHGNCNSFSKTRLQFNWLSSGDQAKTFSTSTVYKLAVCTAWTQKRMYVKYVKCANLKKKNEENQMEYTHTNQWKFKQIE